MSIILTRLYRPVERAVLTAAMNPRNREAEPEVKVVLIAGMKLRFIDIAPEIVAELPEWSPAEIERESDLTLKDLGIRRLPDESYLNAWARSMLEENGCQDNPESRERMSEAIRQDSNALRFVWVLGGEERKKFGLDDSPELALCLQERAATQSLVAAFARAADYSPGSPYAEQPPPRALGNGKAAGIGRPESLHEGNRETGMSESNASKLNTVLLVAVLSLLLWNLFWKRQPQPTGRFERVNENPRMALDTKTGKLCSTVDIHYDSFKDVEVEGADTFEVPDQWDQARIQSYLKTYRADDPEDFRQPGKKQFREAFDNSLLANCASLE